MFSRKRFSGEGTSKLTQALADKIVSRALKHVKNKKLITIRHFFPCVLPDDSEAEQFCIGPVTFTRTSLFLEKKNEQLKKFTADVERQWSAREVDSKNGLMPSEIKRRKKDIRKSSKFFEKDLRDYFQLYPWIGEIELQEFEEGKSREIANLCLSTALNILRLFFTWEHAEDIRLGKTGQ